MDKLKDEYLEKLQRGENVVIPLHEERVIVRKERKVVEEIVIRREKYIEMQKIKVPVRKEVISIDETKISYDEGDM